jgi:hypothetical protein
MMQLFLEWWSDRLPGRMIPIDGKPYMERYFIGDLNFTFFNWKFRRAFYLQCLLSSDTDAGYHNHPWPAFSIILSGFYKELRLSHTINPISLIDGYKYLLDWKNPLRILTRKVWLFNRLGTDLFHRIVLDETTSARVWTLFVRGPATPHGWGFMYPLHSPGPGENEMSITALRWRQFAKADNDDPSERKLLPGKQVKQYRTGCPF